MNTEISSRQQKTLAKRFEGKTCYQLNLRAFTPEGTLAAAEKRLDFLKNAGIDIVYLCPVTAEDDDTDESAWSERQKASGLKNPKNPYRVKDYFNVDSEYGTIDDLVSFIRAAHAKNMYVLLDLVYVHCGPSCRIVSEYPAFVKKDKNGGYIGNQYHFPVLNYENAALRAYMISNMKFWLSMGIDGFRLDYADGIPEDFWQQAADELKSELANAVILYEGGAAPVNFVDYRYGFSEQCSLYAILNGDFPASDFHKVISESSDSEKAAPLLRYIDNHDIITDGVPLHLGGEDEAEQPRVKINAYFSDDQIMAAHAIIETLNGLPMIYTGYEIGSRAPQSLFSNRFYGNMHADLAAADTPEGKEHYCWLKTLCTLRKNTPALYRGETVNEGTADETKRIVRYDRTLAGGKKVTFSRVSVYVNVTKEKSFLPKNVVGENANILVSRLVEQNENGYEFAPFGVLISGYEK